MIVRTKEESKSLEELKKRKLELEIRKLELEVWEKEKHLGVAHCQLTDKAVVEIVPSIINESINYDTLFSSLY